MGFISVRNECVTSHQVNQTSSFGAAPDHGSQLEPQYTIGLVCFLKPLQDGFTLAFLILQAGFPQSQIAYYSTHRHIQLVGILTLQAVR